MGVRVFDPESRITVPVKATHLNTKYKEGRKLGPVKSAKANLPQHGHLKAAPQSCAEES